MLDVAAERLARYAPRTYQADLLEPLELQPRAFGSIAATHVLHCVPGDDGREGRDPRAPLGALLRPGGVLFGTTVLAGGVPQTLLSRAHIAGLNREGIFSNRGDTLDGLRSELDARFDDYALTTRGSLAIFEIRESRRRGRPPAPRTTVKQCASARLLGPRGPSAADRGRDPSTIQTALQSQKFC